MSHSFSDGLPSGIFSALAHLYPGDPVIPGDPTIPPNPIFEAPGPGGTIIHAIFGEAPIVPVDLLGVAGLPHDPMIG